MKHYQRLKEIRESRGKTQSEIAEILGTSRQQYSHWENGTHKMPIKHYKTLVKYYNISSDYILGLIDTPKDLI